MRKKSLSFTIGQRTFRSSLSPVAIDNLHNCVNCGNETIIEIVTITQHGILDDRVTSVFGCPNCRQYFHCVYMVEARYGLTCVESPGVSPA